MKKAIVSLMLLLTSFWGQANQAYSSALTIENVYSDERDADIDVYYWYPTLSEKKDFTFGNQRIFQAEESTLDGAIATGRFPIVLLSQGGLRSAFSHTGWVASAIAKKGYIVIVPKPPGGQQITASLAAQEIALRAADLSLGLSHLQNVKALADQTDNDKVQGVGFFLGGTAMLALAGVTIDPTKYRQSCDSVGVNVDCRWFRQSGVTLADIPDQTISANRADIRIQSIKVINPELTKTFAPDSLDKVEIPVTLVDLAAEPNPALQPSDTMDLIPDIKRISITNATAFSAFSVCTKKGFFILSEEGEAEICEENGKLSKQENHQKIINALFPTTE